MWAPKCQLLMAFTRLCDGLPAYYSELTYFFFRFICYFLGDYLNVYLFLLTRFALCVCVENACKMFNYKTLMTIWRKKHLLQNHFSPAARCNGKRLLLHLK